MIRTISPSTNKVVCEIPETILKNGRTIARASQDAFSGFSSMPFNDRRAIVVRALKMIQERKMELGEELMKQMGRPIACAHKEIETMQKRADYLLETAEEALSDMPGRPEAGFQRWVKKVPIGPVFIISAWNVRKYPQSCVVPLPFYGPPNPILLQVSISAPRQRLGPRSPYW